MLDVLNLGVWILVLLLPLSVLFGSALLGRGNMEPTASQDNLGLRSFVLLARGCLLAASAALLGTLLGVVAGYSVSVQPQGLQHRLGSLMVLPLVIPPFIHALSWIMFADGFGGAFHGFWSAVLVLGLSFWPIAGLLTWVGLVASRGSATEAALLSASRLRVFARIELGLIRPHLLTAMLLIGFFSFSDYGVPSLLRVTTYPVLVFSQFAAFYDLRSAVVSSWPYAMLPMMALVLWRVRAAPRLFEALGQSSRPDLHPVGRASRRLSLALLVVLLLVSAGLPLGVLLRSAGGAGTYLAAWATAKSQIVASVSLGLIAATLISLIGFSLSLGILYSRRLAGLLQDYASLLPIAMPGTLFGIALILVWNHPRTEFIYGTTAVVVLLYLARFLPFAIRAHMVGLSQIGRDLLDAARLSPASSVARIRRIILPLAAPSLVVGWTLGFVLSTQELPGTLLVTPPGVETLAVRIYSLYHYGAGKLLAALCLFTILGSLLIIWIATVLHRNLRTHSESRI